MIDIACHDCIRFGTFGLTHVGTRRDESVRMVEGLLALSFSDSAACCYLMAWLLRLKRSWLMDSSPIGNQKQRTCDIITRLHDDMVVVPTFIDSSKSNHLKPRSAF